MASRSEQRTQDQATQQRRDAACAAIVRHAHIDGNSADSTIDKEESRGIAVGVLSALVKAIADESADVVELRRKGWQTKAKDLNMAAEIVADWRTALVAYTPPKPIEGPKVTVTSSATTDAQGIPVSARAGSQAELDGRLAAAFGPNLAPVRHIRTTVEDNTGEPNIPADREIVYGTLCNATDGSWTHRGGANCETCIATYDAEHGPYTGPVAYGNTERRDEPVTPAVAAAIRAEVEAENAQVREALADEMTPLQLDDTVAVVSPEDAAVFKVGESPFETIRREAVEQITTVLDERVARERALGIDAGGAALQAFVTPPFVDPTPTTRPRMTLAEVREHGIARRRGAEHRSVSQIEGISDCGTRYALSDLERPAWWNVGGKALHRAVETINRDTAHTGNVANSRDLEALFLRALDEEIADQHAATPQFPMDTWRASKKGSEHYDFWRVEGPVMVQRWVAWLSGMLADGWAIATVPSDEHPREVFIPVIEYERYLNVGLEVPDLSIIDLALYRASHNELLIVDIKAGASAPKSTFQLGVYGWALLAAGIAAFTPVPDLSNIRGVYWRARTGVPVPNLGDSSVGWPVLQQNPWPYVVQRFRDGDTLDRAGIYTPNVTSFCGGCGVRDLCPAQS